MTVLDGHAQSPRTGDPSAFASVCPECGHAYAPKHPNQMFCCTPHRKAFLNRQTVRGAVLTPLVMAARISRGGSRGDVATGRRARRDGEFLINKWVQEDRAVGRMHMLDYIALCYRKGFERK